jgi:CHASE2 domain-containing sensor protein
MIRSFWRELRRAAFVILSVSLLTLVLEHLGFLHGFEFYFRDLFLSLRAPKQLQNVRIIGIDSDDYQNFFAGHLPLDSDKVQQLIQAVARAKPRIIGIDLDTASWNPDTVWDQEKLLPMDPKPMVIWARDVNIDSAHHLIPLQVQGGLKPLYAADTGLAIFPKDPDGIFRRSFREVDVGGRSVPTFQWVVFESAYPERANKTLKSGNELTLNFAGNLYALNSLPAQAVLKMASGPGFSDDNYFKDKIVLIGNIFHTARDEHATPVGMLPGVMLMAQAVESEAEGGGIHQLDELKMLGLEVALGVGLVILHRYVSLGLSFLISVVGAFILAPVCSYIAFSSATMWMNFIPIIVAVLIHQLYDNAKEYRKLYVAAQAKNEKPSADSPPSSEAAADKEPRLSSPQTQVSDQPLH